MKVLAAVGLVLATVWPTSPVAGATPPCLETVGGVNLTTATIPQLGQAMATGKLTSAALVDAYLTRIRAYDLAGAIPPNSVRAVNPRAREQAVALDADRAAGRVRGPLHGIPVLLKDNIGTVDQPTTAGSIALARNMPKRDAFVTKRLRDAGAVILGKANLAEFANWVSLDMPNGYSSLGGQVSSAYDGSNPSGSSSGSAVAMSLALAAATIGSETAGSIISPASYAGIVGVKPSIGVVSRAGVVPLAYSWDTTGPMTRSVIDAALVLNAIAGPDPNDPVTADHPSRDFTTAIKDDAIKGARMGFDPAYSGAVFDKALADLEAKGAELVEVDGTDVVFLTAATELGGIFNQFKYGINNYLAAEAGPGLPVKTLSDIIAFNQQHPDKVKYGQDLLIASNATPGLEPLGTAQATPTIAATSAELEVLFTQNDLDAMVAPGDFFSYHAAASHWSSLVVPAGMAGKVPEGIQFIGRPFTEAQLLGYAAAFEPLGRARVPSPTALNSALVEAACKTIAAAPAPAPAPSVRGQVLARTGADATLWPLALIALALGVRRLTRRR